MGEIVEAVIKEQWCDCRVLRVIPPTAEEIQKDKEEEEAERLKENGGKEESPKSKEKREKKSFQPLDHLFKYEVEEIEPDNEDANEVTNCLRNPSYAFSNLDF